jgi:hypothetical protein
MKPTDCKVFWLPETIDDYVSEESPVRVIDAFVGALDIESLGFEVAPKLGEQAACSRRYANNPAVEANLAIESRPGQVPLSHPLESRM